MAAHSYTAFLGGTQVAHGPLPDVARAAAAAMRRAGGTAPLVFDDADGRQLELDLRGTPTQAAARATSALRATPAPAPQPQRGRGRPQLGVVAREVTLLPQQWEWLSLQPGGASVTLRKLVDEARRATGKNDPRLAQERTYRFLHALAGDLPGYEEALRALYRRQREDFDKASAPWPEDVRRYARKLAQGAFEA
jgi:hypothetical protein